MWNRSLQEFTYKIAYYCATALVLSIITWDAQVLAQGAGLEKLLDQLGKNAQGQSRQRQRTTLPQQNLQGDQDEQLEGSEDREISRFELTPEERIIVNGVCVGDVEADDVRVAFLSDKFSRLEVDFCQRVGRRIQQYGYEFFGEESRERLLSSGAIQDHYVLGEGDELIVSFYGAESGSDSVVIDRQGRFMVRDLPPVVAAGMTFGEFRMWLRANIKKRKIGTEVFLSLGSVKSVSVVVAGEIVKPGRYQLTALSSVLDAIMQAGGIKKTGSLRSLQLIRGNQIHWIDMYDLLFAGGFSQDLAIRDGDRLVIPLIGPTIAVSGFVKRPAIYELAEGKNTVSIEGALKFSGGGIRPRGNSVRVISFDNTGQEKSLDKVDHTGNVRGGDIVLLERKADIQLNTVELVGHVRVAGKRSLSSAATLRDLIGNENILKESPYLLFAALETTDPSTHARRLFPINLRRILSNEENFALRDGDKLMVLNADDVSFLNSRDVQKILRNKSIDSQRQSGLAISKIKIDEKPDAKDKSAVVKKTQLISSNTQLTREIVQNLVDRKLIKLTPEEKSKIEFELARDKNTSCEGLQKLSSLVKIAGNRRYRSAILKQSYGDENEIKDLRRCPRLFNEQPDLLPFVLEHVIAINGEVRHPGAYPVTSNTKLGPIIAVAGGLTGNVNLARLEISRHRSDKKVRDVINLTKNPIDSVRFNPGDVARFNAAYTDIESGPVRLSGEFVRPGLYDIRRGERLSQVIARAGGLTRQAYPYGSIFTRESVKVAQKKAFKRTAGELRASAIFVGGRKDASPQTMAALKDLTDRIENSEPLGRVVMESDPTVLQVRPELDTVLEAGDTIYVPKRPNSVLVIGDILNPGALQFVAGTKVDEYVNQAGGFQHSADEDRMYLVYPNGVAQPVSVSVWNYNPVQVPPGSTVVVPKDARPLDLFTFAKDITSLISQMAITAASLAVIGNN